MTASFEVGAAVSFEAFHVMPGAEGVEGKLHPHRYSVEVAVARKELGDGGMVVDLDVLTDKVGEIASRVTARELQEIIDTSAPAVTVEVFAKWWHEQVSVVLPMPAPDRIAVRVWESASAFGGYAGPSAFAGS